MKKINFLLATGKPNGELVAFLVLLKTNMELTYINILRVSANDWRRMHIIEPSDNLLLLLKNKDIIENISNIIWDYNSVELHDSTKLETDLNYIISKIEKRGWNKYWINRTTFKFFRADKRQQFNTHDTWFEPVSENEYNEFVKMASYEEAIERMVRSMPQNSNATASLEIRKFIEYYIYTNTSKILTLTLNWEKSFSDIHYVIERCKDIKNGLRKRTQWGRNDLIAYQTSWN